MIKKLIIFIIILIISGMLLYISITYYNNKQLMKKELDYKEKRTEHLINIVSNVYFTTDKSIRDYVELSKLGVFSLEIKNKTLALLVNKYEPYIKQIQRTASETGKVITDEEALLEFQKKVIITKSIEIESSILKDEIYKTLLDIQIIKNTEIYKEYIEFQDLTNKLENNTASEYEIEKRNNLSYIYSSGIFYDSEELNQIKIYNKQLDSLNNRYNQILNDAANLRLNIINIANKLN